MKKKAYPVRFGLFFWICFFFVFSFNGCGIEDYPYLYPVPQGNITREFNSRATIRINSTENTTSSNSPFYNYAIYYRIYV
ncbi:MAG: hypothetical protein LBF77_08885, partial [Spirochaetaceae bacterium]|nr:hypothetical protein [Spirochaetaceae bacterium]